MNLPSTPQGICFSTTDVSIGVPWYCQGGWAACPEAWACCTSLFCSALPAPSLPVPARRGYLSPGAQTGKIFPNVEFAVLRTQRGLSHLCILLSEGKYKIQLESMPWHPQTLKTVLIWGLWTSKVYLLSPEAHKTKTPKAFLLAFISVTGPKMWCYFLIYKLGGKRETVSKPSICHSPRVALNSRPRNQCGRFATAMYVHAP